MLRHLLLLALGVFPAIAIECDKCAGRRCFKTCYYLQKVLTAEAKYKCCSASADDVEQSDQCLIDDEGCDGSAAGVDQCFFNGGNCASCCGACVKTTDLDNSATTETCVCFEASSAPSSTFVGTEKNDCVFIAADDVQLIYVRNQCLGRRGGSSRPATERKLILGTR